MQPPGQQQSHQNNPQQLANTSNACQGGESQQSMATMSMSNAIGGQSSHSMLSHGGMGVAANAGQNPLGGNNVTATGATVSGTSGMANMPGTSAGGGQGTGGGQQMPSAADISLMLSLGLGLNPSEAHQLANWDLQKLAMYLVSNFSEFTITMQSIRTSKYRYQPKSNPNQESLYFNHFRKYNKKRTFYYIFHSKYFIGAVSNTILKRTSLCSFVLLSFSQQALIY